MTEADFDAIERYLGRPLPRRYREVMTCYPLDPADENSRLALFDDPREVLAWNAELREGEFAAEWAADRLAVGCSPCGDTYFLDLTGGSSAVFAWDHETHAVAEEAADLDRFVEGWKRHEAEAKGRGASGRRWWRPWG